MSGGNAQATRRGAAVSFGLAVVALLLIPPSGGNRERGPLGGAVHAYPGDPAPQWGTPESQSPPDGPNIVFILADDLGWGDPH
ncbi:MAG: hypothetical protein ACYTES_16985, partial [Planctomycetota bacterium]